ncbi:hypothetical protein [Faecalibacterium sp.]|uniref:hypothetical protein n=1 Tax=Faecalibacterium sp. TaxID=1971605 RepID=UPI003526DE3E
MAVEVNWENFASNNNDPDGVQHKFENLCRQLFTNDYLKENKKSRNLHSNPNNPGIEAEPILDERTNQYIGFQVKFFDTSVDYGQILHSMEKALQYYTGKLSHIVLYCNKAITSTSKSYINIVELLKKNNITIELVTDSAILDAVRKYPYLANYYFGVNTISFEWVVAHNEKSFCDLGERFNRDFNVETETSKRLSLFARDQSAVQYINDKKENLIRKINRIKDDTEQHSDYLEKVRSIVSAFEDVESETIGSAFEWHQYLQSFIVDDLAKINSEISQKKNLLEKIRPTIEKGRSRVEHKDLEKYNSIRSEIEILYELLDLPEILSLTADENRLITAKELFVTGNAGIGKSHLLAAECQSLMNNQQFAVLLLAGNCYSDLPILDQLSQDCELKYSFDEFISILEMIGVEHHTCVLLCIDALNETANYRLWKTGLISLSQKIKKCTHVKLAVTYRMEYEKSVVQDALLSEDEDVYRIVHTGFASNGLKASKQFFDYYRIPFTLYEYFESEMENPLFLTLYCKTYRNDEASLPTLYDRLVESANKNIFPILEKRYKLIGFTEDDNIVQSLVDEISTLAFDRKEKNILESDLASIPFWTANDLPLRPFMSLLAKENLVHTNLIAGNERYFFAYDQMNDYFFARSLFSHDMSDMSIRKTLYEDILQVNDNNIVNLSNSDVFVICCAIYAQKFGKECIDLIDELPEGFEKGYIVKSYIRSFIWRDKEYISSNVFLAVAQKYKVSREDFWNVLVGNSIKHNHPLNSDFLHTLLMSFRLSERDYYWTKYINEIFYDESNRLMQLVKMYSSGQSIQMSKEQARQLLILCGWLLSSSNRMLRDYTSEAMIEILRNEFDLCIVILKAFEKVNDPYIIERLYGVVFGACCKRRRKGNTVYIALAEYVYSTIFDQEFIYPDILLRDYARLIIERFLWENPDYNGCIVHEKIIPPYKSFPIEQIDEDYINKKYDGGLWQIKSSMSFEGHGMYGDFGRYVFQSALKYFDVDEDEMYKQAMSFIINDLGYTNELDKGNNHWGYDRSETKKVERIGKKYQWIAMHNILARVSDQCDIDTDYSETPKFEGPWEPFVRDFDPTLNFKLTKSDEIPIFDEISELKKATRDEHLKVDVSNIDSVSEWLDSDGIFFAEMPKALILSDSNGTQWIRLSNYICSGREQLKAERLLTWSWLYAYFVTEEQFEQFQVAATDRVDFSSSKGIGLDPQSYSVFNREYPWSPSCDLLNKSSSVESGVVLNMPEEKEVEQEVLNVEFLEQYLKSLDADSNQVFSDQELNQHLFKKEIVRKPVLKQIGEIIHASINLVWESEYDASKDNTLSMNVPCPMLIEQLHLHQADIDGLYYDSNEKIAAFDLNISQKESGVVLRKDLLDAFLKKNNLNLIWFVRASKELHSGEDLGILRYGDRSGAYFYNGTEITSNIYIVEQR